MCFITSIIEIFAIVTAILSAVLGKQLQDFNIPNIHFPYVIVMSIIIPFIYLLNDGAEKEVIFQSGWYQGVRYVLGIYTAPTIANNSLGRNLIPMARLNYHQNLSNFFKFSRSHPTFQHPDASLSPDKTTLSRCQSSVELIVHHEIIKNNNMVLSKRRNSVGDVCLGVLVSSIRKSPNHISPKSIELPILWNNSQLNEKTHSLKSSSSSISTIYLSEN